jgi:hypothetical protein
LGDKLVAVASAVQALQLEQVVPVLAQELK